MLFQEPRPTGYELNFRVFNIPVSVHPFFWIVGLVLIGGFAISPGDGGNALVNLALAMFVWFFSILIHELGHSLVMGYYGIRSRIWLYAFGGLAIPENFSYGRSRYSQWQKVHISAAGPMAQIILYFIVILFFIPLGYRLTLEPSLSIFYPNIVLDEDGGSKAMLVFGPVSIWKLLHIHWFVNWIIALFNLLPIFPLDGGQIMKEIMDKKFGHRGFEYTLWVTVGVSIFVALMLFQANHAMAGIVVGILGFQAFQQLQGAGGGRF